MKSFLKIAAIPAIFVGMTVILALLGTATNVVADGFDSAQPNILTDKCRSTYNGVALYWDPVAGADGYEIERAAWPEGEYEPLTVTEDIKLRAKADGEYCYRVRALKGREKSRWSRAVRIFSASAYIKEMYYDQSGQTHFTVAVSNRTDRPMYFFGAEDNDNGLYPAYRLYQYDLQTGERTGSPYPITAAPGWDINQAMEIPPNTEETLIDLSVPVKLPWYGENGTRGAAEADGVAADTNDTAAGSDAAATDANDATTNTDDTATTPDAAATNPDGTAAVSPAMGIQFAYRLAMDVYPQMEEPAFVLTVTDNVKESKVTGLSER